MKTLKQYRLIPYDSKCIELEKRSWTMAILGTIPAIVVGYSPLFFIRELYSLKLGYKLGIFCTLTLICYAGVNYGAIRELNDHNRETIHKYADCI